MHYEAGIKKLFKVGFQSSKQPYYKEHFCLDSLTFFSYLVYHGKLKLLIEIVYLFSTDDRQYRPVWVSLLQPHFLLMS